jgi:hypothetical protein
MGYRGSKSGYLTYPVKEQRVDGSYCIIKPMQLRCTLMGFERSYQIKIPSKQINNQNFSTLSPQPKLNPLFISGFADAEGSFNVSITPFSENKIK